MALLVTAVVARDDDDGVVVNASFFEGLDDAPHTNINAGEIVVIAFGVPTSTVPDAINAVEDGDEQHGLFVYDILDDMVAVALHRLPVFLEILQIANGQRVNDILYAFPFVGAARFGFGALLADKGKDGREEAVGIGDHWADVGRFRVPGGVAMHFRPRSHEHGRPIDARA